MDKERLAFLELRKVDLTTGRPSQPIEVGSRSVAADKPMKLFRRIGLHGVTPFLAVHAAVAGAAPDSVPYSHTK